MINKTKCLFFKKINKIVKNCRMVYQEKQREDLKIKAEVKGEKLKFIPHKYKGS